MYQIARNLLIDARRHAHRQRELAATVTRQLPTEDGRDNADAADAFAIVARAPPMFIDDLDAPYRDALRLGLVELEGMTQVEAARRVGISFSLARQGDTWTIQADTTFTLRDSRGLRILSRLVEHPGREFHATDLVAPPGEVGHVEDAGEAIDAEAIAAYKRRVEDLRAVEAEAEAHNDSAKATRARAEIEAIASELARGVGLGGRGRKASSTAEKARVNVRQRLSHAMKRIAEHSPALAKHLRQAIHTGSFCRYDP